MYDVQQTLVWYCNILLLDYRDICWDTDVTPPWDPRESPFHIFEHAWEWGSGEGGAAYSVHGRLSQLADVRVGGRPVLPFRYVTCDCLWHLSNFELLFQPVWLWAQGVRLNQSANMWGCCGVIKRALCWFSESSNSKGEKYYQQFLFQTVTCSSDFRLKNISMLLFFPLLIFYLETANGRKRDSTERSIGKIIFFGPNSVTPFPLQETDLVIRNSCPGFLEVSSAPLPPPL